jgi:hypothetical protein
MSSTNRGGQRSPSDNYSTPSWCTRRILEAVSLPGGVWLDPGAGSGKIIRAVNAVRSDVVWDAVEVRDECLPDLVSAGATTMITSFLEFGALSLPRRPDIILTNPPYRLAEEFIDLCLPLAKVATVMLLRLNYLGSQRRSDFMRRFPPDVFILPNRPAFTTNKKGKMSTDSIEYAWFYWPSGKPRQSGSIRVLASTSKTERDEG